MSIAIFIVLAVAVAAVVAYPLLPGRMPAEPAPAVTDGEIERAVRALRRARSRGGQTTSEEQSCPNCGQAYQAGDRFCVGCGGALPQPQVTLGGRVCPSCGAIARDGDRFCSRCGSSIAGEEVA